jgi:hypothetical protein
MGDAEGGVERQREVFPIDGGLEDWRGDRARWWCSRQDDVVWSGLVCAAVQILSVLRLMPRPCEWGPWTGRGRYHVIRLSLASGLSLEEGRRRRQMDQPEGVAAHVQQPYAWHP